MLQLNYSTGSSLTLGGRQEAKITQKLKYSNYTSIQVFYCPSGTVAGRWEVKTTQNLKSFKELEGQLFYCF